jgi:thiol-disulfide isomerase/thioredoxin
MKVRAIRKLFVFVSVCYAFFGTAGAELPEGLEANGARLVWVDFWASWCAPCRRSFPWMNAMQQKYSADGFSVIAVNVDKDRALAEEFLAEYPAQFPIHYDPSGTLAQAYDVQAMPSSFLMDAQGNVLASHYGFRLADASEYEAKIRAALESLAAD